MLARLLRVTFAAGALLVVPAMQAGNILHGVGGDFRGFDPVDCGDVESADQVSRVYEGLLEYHYLDRPYRVVPRLATSLPEVSADKLTYTFKVRRGVKFMDDPCFPGGQGRAVRAEDFVYSFKRIIFPEFQSQGDWIFVAHVLGAQAWAKKGDFDAPVPGFTALDEETLQIKLEHPYPQLLWVLTMPYAFVIPKEAVEFYGKEFRNHPVGTGPFRLKSWRRRYRIEYERNPSFNGQEYPHQGEAADREAGLLADAGQPLPLLDGIIEYDIQEYYTSWQMFLGGQLAAAGINKDYFEKVIDPHLELSPALKKKGIRLYKTPSLSTYYIGFNMKDPVVGATKDAATNERRRKLRQAFACAIDVPTFCEVAFNNRHTPASSPIPPGVAGHTKNSNPYKFDLARAKQLIAEAGYPGGRDANGRQLRLTMIMPGAGSTDTRQMAQFFTEHLRAIGVDLVVQQLSFAEYLRREHEGETQVFWAGWVIDYPDAQNFLQLLYGPNRAPGVNATNYENAEFDRLYEQIAVMQDSPERTALYERMVTIAMADCPWALLTYPLSYGLFQPWFQNYKPHAFPYANWKYLKVLPH